MRYSVILNRFVLILILTLAISSVGFSYEIYPVIQRTDVIKRNSSYAKKITLEINNDIFRRKLADFLLIPFELVRVPVVKISYHFYDENGHILMSFVDSKDKLSHDDDNRILNKTVDYVISRFQGKSIKESEDFVFKIK